MATVRERWNSLPSLYKRTSAFLGVMASVAAVYAMAATFFAVSLRPAWAWELEDLTRSQVQLQITVEQIQRREFSRDLNNYRAMRDERIRMSQPVPGWLTEEISNGESDLVRIDGQIRNLQQRLVDLSD